MWNRKHLGMGGTRRVLLRTKPQILFVMLSLFSHEANSINQLLFYQYLQAPSSNPFGRFSAFSSPTPSSNAASLATSGSAGFLSKPSFGISAFTAPASESSNKEKDESKESTSSLFSTTAPSVSASNFPSDNEKEKTDVIPTANLNDKSKVTDSKASSKDEVDAPTDSCYSAQITALNISFLNWIKLHIEGNPLVDLTPVFNDYTKHMTDIEGKYGAKQGSNSSSKTANDKEAVSKIQIAESKTKTQSESISIFSAADKKDAGIDLVSSPFENVSYLRMKRRRNS